MRGEEAPAGDADQLARSAAGLGIALPTDWSAIAGPEDPATEADPALAIWPDHWDAVRLVAALASQWRVSVGGDRLIWLGLDYAAVEVTARLMGIGMSPTLFAQVQTLEAGITPALNRR